MVENLVEAERGGPNSQSVNTIFFISLNKHHKKGIT
jgi:hypothetical protein